jgi:dipeptide/tripeptide permease
MKNEDDVVPSPAEGLSAQGFDAAVSVPHPYRPLRRPAGSDTFADTPQSTSNRQLGLLAAISSLGYVFWIVGGMEMVERLAFYGVKAVATLYAKDPVSRGGLGITMSSFGTILMTWALVQSILPVFTGGLSDRYGYKRTIFISTLIKIAGYLVMAFNPSYYGFFCGALLLAAGTAIFKPGIQGTLVNATSRENSSMAWGIFYQTVNIGGFLGPLMAGLLRKLAWQHVFFACAAIICLNFILLLLYQEPGQKGESARTAQPAKESLWRESLRELSQPHVWIYLGVFSGFWFMFNALFDVLPAHIEDWVDSRGVVATLVGGSENINPLLSFFVVLSKDGKSILPEGMLNLNAGLIMLTCFFFAFLSGKIRATSSMVIGTFLASCALFTAGYVTSGWCMLMAIAIFSVGEMLSSPKFSEFIGNFAPPGKKAMYLGFSQIPLAIGWTLEGKLGPMLYDHFASKERFSRELLLSEGMDAARVDAIPVGEAFNHLVAFTAKAPEVLTQQLYNGHQVGMVWYIMGAIGIFSALGIYAYGRAFNRVEH